MNNQQIAIFLLMVTSTVSYVNALLNFPLKTSLIEIRSQIQVYNDRNESMNIEIESVNARFGPNVLDFGGLQGYLAIADPIDACSTIKSPHVVSHINKWIALIEDNICVKKCSLEQKVFNAQNAGYAAVIIYSQDFTTDMLVQKQINYEYDINIPTIFIESSKAETLKQFSFESKSYLIIKEYMILGFYLIVTLISVLNFLILAFVTPILIAILIVGCVFLLKTMSVIYCSIKFYFCERL
jgi:hypothetical protein